MINRLSLRSFKAHKELEIPFNKRSFLLYGDNGVGKSSIYDALKLEFFRDKIENSIEAKDIATEVSQADKDDFFRNYNNTILNNDFSIKLEKDSNKEYQVFMLNLEDTEFDRYLNFNTLIDSIYFNLPSTFNYNEIEYNINKLLIKFKEDIRATIDREDFSIRVTDSNRSIYEEKNIKQFFNEAKLNLVVFAILFSMIELYQDENKDRILILDDFITSLDMSNRTFLMKYILETFGDKFQIIILTHNVYFYNLIMYLINDIYKIKDNWQYTNLYEIGNEHKLYINDDLIELSKLRKEIYGQNPQYTRIGNDLRKKFERLLYEFSKILMIGGVEESNKILEILDKKENLYLLRHEYKDAKNKKQFMFKNSNHLVLEIEELINENKSIEDIRNLISKYSEVDNLLPDIIKIIRELKLYQKVSMHSLSHGQIGQNPISQKEIEKSLELLEYFQDKIKGLVNKKVDGL